MICPVCSAESNNNSCCEYCGAKLESNEHEKENKMIFNIVYAVIILWSGIGSSFGSLSVFLTTLIVAAVQSSISFEFFVSIIVLAVGAFSILTGIALLKKKRLGYIFANITSITNCVGALIMSGLSVWMMYVESISTNTSEYVGLGYFVGALFLIAAIPSLAFHISALFYYKKNKHKFIN